MKHSNIALFVTHSGCPHSCTFCNQRVITGNPQTAKPEDVSEAVSIALAHGDRGAQLAFFGGSFTAIPKDYMISLLDAAKPFVENGDISGIRISTRPDYIDEEILDILKAYGVEAIELGAQSMDDEVLALNRRGHSSEDVERASELIKEYGFELGLQMMSGLYGDTEEKTLQTAEKLIKLKPSTIRIYPTVVLEGTELAKLLREGRYKPQELDEAVEICAKLLPMFNDAGIKVIRLGLHSGGGVEEGYIAGAYHPAFRELVEGELYYSLAMKALEGTEPGNVTLLVAPSEISKMTGQRRKNILKLNDNGFNCKVRAESGLQKYHVEVVNTWF